MAPGGPHQLLVWTVPTIALLLSYFWFKKKRIQASCISSESSVSSRNDRSLKEELEEAISDTTDGRSPSPNRSFSRSLSGVDSAPIDIILPRELRSHKSNPVVISDEDLDLEIQKIKSMKSAAAEPFRKPQTSIKEPKNSPTVEVKQKSPVSRELSPPDSYTSPEITPKYKSPKVIKCAPQKIILSSSTSPMAQKHAAKSAEEKLSNAKVQEVFNDDCSLKCVPSNMSTKVVEEKTVENEDIRRQTCERDSANHSPADAMLASPSLSSISDNHSEGSSDSGKGGSDVVTPPSRTPAGDNSLSENVSSWVLYEFAIPQGMVGRLIGRGGCSISEIKAKSGARIMIKKHPTNTKLKICVIEGTQLNVDAALQFIREKFPLKRFPELTMDQISIQHTPVSLTPDQLYLKLIEGINNDTIISCMVTPNHFFVQQPTHPTFPNLNVLSNCMNMCYNTTESPLLPTPISDNTICAALSEGDWYRVMVMSSDAETNTSNVVFLDYGGYACIENSKLKQIRGDYLLLPFQAAECILANVRPPAGEKWSDEAYSIVAELTKGALAFTQVADYTSGGVPLVLMYIFVGPQEVVYLNEELVNRGLAEWVSLTEQDEMEGAVGGIQS